MAASMKWLTASATKVPDPQAGSRTYWSRGSVTTSRTMARASQSRGVVLSQLAPLVGRYDGLVEDGGNIVGSLLPVEPGYTTSLDSQQGQPAYLGGPREEVRLHDSLKTGLASEVAAKQQVRRVVLRQALDVAAEGGLDHHADDGAQVCVSDEQVVQLTS